MRKLILSVPILTILLIKELTAINHCSNIFKYNLKGVEWFGVMTIPYNPNMEHGVIKLNVSLTVKAMLSVNKC